jgi:rhamnosyltransferase
MNAVTVAIPVRNGGRMLAQTLDGVRRQQVDAEVELLVADSGSTDGSRELTEAAGATVIDVEPGEFSHGGTRNLLAERARGDHIAFLTQDATPADEHWLARLLEGFALDERVGLVFGPYRARPHASLMVRRELDDWFLSFAPDGQPRVDRQAVGDRASFFTDANGCVAREAWQQVPFRPVSYAEDQMLAHDLMSAGWAKTYHPAAVVIHSHDYTPGQVLRRSFDEARALREVRSHRAHPGPARPALVLQRRVRDDLALARDEGASRAALAPRSLAHQGARTLGEVLGSRADRLPERARRLLSLEGRGGFDPQ